MSVLVCGSRDYDDRNKLYKILDRVFLNKKYNCIIEGGCRGADLIAREYAITNGICFQSYPADWCKYGKAAGVIRNSEMLEKSPLLVVAFSSCTYLTAGTKDTITKAKKLGIRVKVVLSE